VFGFLLVHYYLFTKNTFVVLKVILKFGMPTLCINCILGFAFQAITAKN